jgi:hypothetical protein
LGIFARSITFAASLAAATSVAATASAGDMDPTPERFRLQPPGMPAGFDCAGIAANPGDFVAKTGQTPNNFSCRPNNAAFRNMVSELGFALAPSVMRPARTTGYGGFSLSLEASFTSINADGAVDGVKYWEQGTRGALNGKSFAAKNSSPDSLLQIYSLKARKGLPLGFELGTNLGYVAGTSMWVIGGDIRWAILEGFRKGPLGYMPDLAVSGGVNTLVGSSKMYLTTVGINVVVSKPFTFADTGALSPFIGYQRLIVFGNSTIVDLTPNVDALERCGYQGTDPTSGAPLCAKKLKVNGVDTAAPDNADFNNSTTFNPVRIHRHRLLLGATYAYEIVKVGIQFATDLTDPGSENYAITGTRQWTLSFDGGISF